MGANNNTRNWMRGYNTSRRIEVKGYNLKRGFTAVREFDTVEIAQQTVLGVYY